MKDNCAIVIMSCDSYSDLWNKFFELKEKYWSDCLFRCYLVTNNITASYDEVETILCGDSLNWTGRLIKALKQIHEKNVILMLEDYYISSMVDNSKVIEILRYMDESGAVYCKLETRGTKFKKIHNDVEYLREITPDIRYGVSLITSIWNKEFLLEVIGNEDYPAWEFEIRRNSVCDITRKTDKLLLCDIRNVLNITHMVQRGKYLRSSIKKLKSQGDIIDIGNRGKIDIWFEPYAKLVSVIKNYSWIRKILIKIAHIIGVFSISEKYADEMERGIYK